MSHSKDPAGGPWHLDKRVPIVTLLGLVAQFVGFIIAGSYYAANFEARLRALEVYQADTKGAQSDLAVIKSQIIDIKDALRRMEEQLTEGRP